MVVYTSRRKTRSGGGVLIITSKLVFVEKKWCYSDDATEMIAIYTSNLNTTLIACYIPPTNRYNYTNTVEAFDELKEFLNTLPNDVNIIVYGDFNLNCLNYEKNEDDELEPVISGIPLEEEEKEEQEFSGTTADMAIANKLVEFSDEFNLEQIVEKPTFRKQEDRGKSFLDQIFTNIEARSEVDSALY